MQRVSATELNKEGRILWFDDFDGPNQYGFLSNFYEGEPFNVLGDPFPTGEHAFQAFKADRQLHVGERDFHRIRTAPTPGAAKSIGRSIRLRSDWEAVKYDVMMAVLRSKFAYGRTEANLLLDTGDALLTEGTFWRDRVWGVDLGGTWAEGSGTPEFAHFAPGRNWLGTLLMARRAELRALANHGYATNAGAYNESFIETREI